MRSSGTFNDHFSIILEFLQPVLKGNLTYLKIGKIA